METEILSSVGLSRRRFALAATLFAWSLPRLAGAAQVLRFAASWEEAGRYHAGLLEASDTSLRVLAQTELPTRAHGLLAEPGGTLLVAARRPGDWLLRWHPGSGQRSWQWAETGRAFNGHVATSADGRWRFTTETDLETGAGRVGVREAQALTLHDDWPSGGLDPHALMAEGDTLWVANGGIPTRPETGRSKHDLDRMDSSLVQLDAASGRMRSQWRLDDPRLSLRHLARHGSLIGVALQAEHADAAERAAAPLLALCDGRTLRIADGLSRGAGYTGDIAAGPDGFLLGATRQHQLLHWREGQGWSAPIELGEVCAVTVSDGDVWAAGRQGVLRWHAVDTAPAPWALPVGVRMDNHWVAWPA